MLTFVSVRFTITSWTKTVPERCRFSVHKPKNAIGRGYMQLYMIVCDYMQLHLDGKECHR